MRRAAGGILAGVGGMMLLYAGAAYARGAIERARARTAWEEGDAARVTLAAHRVAGTGPRRAAPPLGSPVAHLLIPAIGVDEVVVEGVEGELRSGPGHLPGSALPGDSGNAVISAHRDRHFHALDALRLGDTVFTETAGDSRRWIVVSRRVVDREAPAIFAAAVPTLTLTTCWPVRYVGPAPDRLIITARAL